MALGGILRRKTRSEDAEELVHCDPITENLSVDFEHRGQADHINRRVVENRRDQSPQEYCFSDRKIQREGGTRTERASRSRSEIQGTRTAGSMNPVFEVVDSKKKIYVKKNCKYPLWYRGGGLSTLWQYFFNKLMISAGEVPFVCVCVKDKH